MPKFKMDVRVDGLTYYSATDTSEQDIGEIAVSIYSVLESVDKFKMVGERGEIYLFGPEAIRRAVITIKEVSE
jgi:hypothetical protein